MENGYILPSPRQNENHDKKARTEAIAEYLAYFERQRFLAPAVPQWLLNNASVVKYCYRSAVVDE